MYKYETHLHTCETSACATASGKAQAQRYKELGYDGIIVTDHFFNGNCLPEIHSCTDWKRKVDMFCTGFERAKAEGDRIGLKVFFGFEYCYEGADVLVYGLDKQWLYDHPEIMEMSFFDFAELAHNDGAVLVHAHPFRQAGYLREIRLMPDYVDAVEVYNCGNFEDIYNDRAYWYALQYGFNMTGGTDNHHLTVTKLSGITSEKPLDTIDDVKTAILSGDIGVIYPEGYKRKEG
ncbi:MAG: histidinol-phosphatase [Ruminococcus sp.]|nr:histidinol-phosphatase [Ruminococcus sp.]